jgi:uncharacterized protein YbjT (DUF2867 family)
VRDALNLVGTIAIAPVHTPSTHSDPRSALLAGTTGLIGRALLTLLLESPHYTSVHALLRRSVGDMPAHPKLHVEVVDFERLPALPAVDDVFIALGTTIKVAGSEAAFRRVDFDAVLATARLARAAGARRAIVVSALGADADADSKVFYNRVKGDMERAVAALGYETVVFARPSLLVGDRAALGQPVRAGERWALRLLRPVLGIVPAGVRPIDAGDVARAMLRAAIDAEPGLRILSSAQMQPRNRRRG